MKSKSVCQSPHPVLMKKDWFVKELKGSLSQLYVSSEKYHMVRAGWDKIRDSQTILVTLK